MKITEIFQALSNEKRLLILEWLKEPEKHFPPSTMEGANFEEVGVCVKEIHQKLNVSQSTASQYLSILQRTELIQATRKGKWTYYKRNEDVIRQLGEFIQKEI